MPDVEKLTEILQKAGLVPDILIIGGWAFAAILVIVLIYNLFMYAIKLLTRKKK